jgi:hypothetical protein
MMIKNISNLLLWGGALAGGGSGGGDTPSGGDGWEPIGDGNTHIWITLPEGRTSLELGCCPNGTVTVDWGDGTEPDVLTGTSTSMIKRTPTHNYAAAGDYVITLTVDGEMYVPGGSSSSYILHHSSYSNGLNKAHLGALRKLEIGDRVGCGHYAFKGCFNLSSVTIPNGVRFLGIDAFAGCFNLSSVTIPDGVTTLNANIFSGCYNLLKVNIPEGLTTINGSVFRDCYCLLNITIPNSVTSINSQVFYNCYSLRKIRFEGTTPPTVADSAAFSNVPTDCVISVPVGSLDAYKTATNYPDPATYTYVEE